MTPVLILILAIFLIVTCAAVAWLMARFKDDVRRDTQAAQANLLQMMQQQFEAQQSRSALELETRRQSIESTVKDLKSELSEYQKIVRELENDRTRKFGHLENELKTASEATRHLQESTNRLNNILGNVKLRGQWGERMAEDIIRYTGLVEGVNYHKQQSTSASSRPDFTFNLPNEHKIHMDVKFPLDNYLQMVNAELPAERERFEKEFFKNVRDRIRELQGREYINPSDNTLDFVLLFIPNEQVYGLIQERVPGLMDEALSQKVVLCSPFTLYAMLSVVRQAYENFRYEKNLKKIVDHIEQFADHYERFKKRFEEVGTGIDKLQKTYEDVSAKSFKQLDTKIRHIEEAKKGSKTGEQLSFLLEAEGVDSDDTVRS